VDTRTDAERALELAYRYIERRERTAAEVRDRLERAALEPGAVQEALAELTEFGYVDDARFARIFAEDKRNLEGWGRDRIERDLLARGIDRETVGFVLGTEAQETEAERAVALLRRRFPSPPEDLRGRERALGVLVRKGYGSDVAYEAVRAWAGG
jgi:regulatory protein